MISRQTVIGFGIGLLFSAAFLYVYPTDEAKSSDLTAEVLEAAAGKQDKVVLTQEEYLQLLEQAEQIQGSPRQDASAPDDQTASPPAPPISTDQPGQQKQQSLSETTKASTAVNAQTAAAHQPTVVQQAADEEKKSATPPPMQKPFRKTKEGVVVTISGGLTSAQIADLLVKSGAISDKLAFLERLWSANKHREVRAGTYTFRNGTSVEEVIRLITTLPER
ncbi:hypothetical protein LOK74_06555 [Brevibacillus humidisoli]|uniref:hypothetical protein n=1 Tax=Brevibacillus humidisoli TaxID=2895522 RepID=UPI001E396B85|nr:hypothetical protein [Brevibacillus humidisoli]UFJ42153.1 hypothetical protein LOK74_06555 [Brevibacillus humidisoli]